MKGIANFTIFLYLTINLGLVLGGIIERNSNYRVSFNDCDTPKIRIGVVFPGFRIGCYLGESIE